MLRCVYTQRRWAHRRGGFVTGGTGWSQKARPAAVMGAKKSEWWAVDGELHEIGEGVPHRERFAIPRDNLPNRRRKQMREQFMRRTRLVLKDSAFLYGWSKWDDCSERNQIRRIVSGVSN